jgi:hypothetical protein
MGNNATAGRLCILSELDLIEDCTHGRTLNSNITEHDPTANLSGGLSSISGADLEEATSAAA